MSELERIEELERKVDIIMKYLDGHDRMFKVMDEKADTIRELSLLNSSLLKKILKP